MTERAKMLAGELYDPSDEELSALRLECETLCRRYNQLTETDPERSLVAEKLLAECGKHVFLRGPVFFDYGVHTKIGDNSFANFNFTCLDCAPVTIGSNVFFGPNVSILTPMHPLRWQERNCFAKADGTMTDLEYAKPIAIGDNCWIGGSVTICGGVTIGEGSVIGAGSVVTRDIPAGVVAVGNPCRVLKPIQ